MNELEEQIELIKSMVGHKITDAKWFDANPNSDWCHHETGVLYLDDGRAIEFSSWGHDADGATIKDITNEESSL